MKFRRPWVGFAVALVGMLAGCARSVPPDFDVAISLDATSLRFGGDVGDIIGEQTVALEVLNDRTLTWQATASAPWIRVTPANGRGPSAIRVSVASTGLAPGVHHGTIKISQTDAAATSTPLSLNLSVELTLTAPGWTSLDGPYGGPILAVAVDPSDPNRVIAANIWTDILLSTDGGDSFAKVFTVGDYDTFDEIYLTTSPRGYAASRWGVFRTDDRGLTWAPTSLQNIEIAQIAIDATDTNHLIARGESLWRSTDGGTNWTEALGESFFFARPAPAGFTEPFILGDRSNQMLGFGASGNPATTLLTSIPGYELHDFALLTDGTWVVAAYDTGPSAPTLFYSTDAGANWTENDTGLTGDIYNWYNYQLLADGNELWVTSVHGVHHGIGATGLYQEIATAYATGSAPNDNRLGLALHPSGPLIPHGSDGVVRVVDGTGLVQSRVFSHWIVGLSVHAASGQLFVVRSRSGLHRWSPSAGFVGMGSRDFTYESISGVSVDPRDPQIVIISTWGTGVLGTRDGGTSWQRLSAGMTNLYLSGLDRAPDNPDVLWVAAGNAGVYRSTDAGATFTLVAADIATRVAAVSATRVMIASKEEAGLLLGTSGVAPSPLHGGSSVNLIARTHDGSLWYYHSYDGLHRSTDEGVTFVQTGFTGTNVQAVAVDPFDPQQIYLGHNGGLLESRDGGATWSSAGAPFEVTSLTVDPTTKVLYVGTAGGGVYTYASP